MSAEGTPHMAEKGQHERPTAATRAAWRVQAAWRATAHGLGGESIASERVLRLLDELDAIERSRTKTCGQCGCSWTAPVTVCPECGTMYEAAGAPTPEPADDTVVGASSPPSCDAVIAAGTQPGPRYGGGPEWCKPCGHKVTTCVQHDCGCPTMQDDPGDHASSPANCDCPTSGLGYRHHRHPCSRAGENEAISSPAEATP